MEHTYSRIWYESGLWNGPEKQHCALQTYRIPNSDLSDLLSLWYGWWNEFQLVSNHGVNFPPSLHSACNAGLWMGGELLPAFPAENNDVRWRLLLIRNHQGNVRMKSHDTNRTTSLQTRQKFPYRYDSHHKVLVGAASTTSTMPIGSGWIPSRAFARVLATSWRWKYFLMFLTIQNAKSGNNRGNAFTRHGTIAGNCGGTEDASWHGRL